MSYEPITDLIKRLEAIRDKALHNRNRGPEGHQTVTELNALIEKLSADRAHWELVYQNSASTDVIRATSAKTMVNFLKED